MDLDAPAMIGALQRRDAYHQGVAATKAFVAPTVGEIADGVLADYAQLTGRRYRRLDAAETDGADFLILAQGSLVPAARRVAARVRETRGDRVGVVGVVMLRPLAVDQLVALLEGRTGVLVLERSVDPFTDGGPLLREVRAVLAQAVENGRQKKHPPFPELPPIDVRRLPGLWSAECGVGGRTVSAGDLQAAIQNMIDGGPRRAVLGIDFVRPTTRLPKLQIWHCPPWASRSSPRRMSERCVCTGSAAGARGPSAGPCWRRSRTIRVGPASEDWGRPARLEACRSLSR